ncbi:MAG: hypothetical protein HQL55_20340 [Magnetococcales bacterium]|nr:hypothetical protein [Magnetococcales bacterium]
MDSHRQIANLKRKIRPKSPPALAVHGGQTRFQIILDSSGLSSNRLAVIVLLLPPLRERTGDLAPLVDHLLEQINRESETEPGFEHKKLSVGARDLLLKHRWPGNVRELQNTLRRAMVWSSGPTIRVEDIRDSLFPIPKGSQESDNILGMDVLQGVDLPAMMDRVARHYLELAMEKTAGNKTRAAELLGLASYQTLSNWLKKYGVQA